MIPPRLLRVKEGEPLALAVCNVINDEEAADHHPQQSYACSTREGPQHRTTMNLPFTALKIVAVMTAAICIHVELSTPEYMALSQPVANASVARQQPTRLTFENVVWQSVKAHLALRLWSVAPPLL